MATSPAAAPRSNTQGIDYSKWDRLFDSDDGEDGGDGEQTIKAIVSGFVGRCASLLNGSYVAMPHTNHGRLVFHRLLDTGGDEVDRVVLYYWDERDGVHMNGWWFGPGVGSNTVWAFNPGDAPQPPPVGWREPWFCDVSPQARVLLENASGPGVEPSDRCAEVPPSLVKGVLAPIVREFRKVARAWRCIDCGGPLRKPVVLPCGHLVCLEHARSAGYCCPWVACCAVWRLHLGPSSEGPCTAGLVERLLLADTSPSSSSTSSGGGAAVTEGGGGGAAGCAAGGRAPGSEEEQEAAVRRARTPMRLADALAQWGDLCAKRGRAAAAAAAFLASRHLYEEFEGPVDFSEASGIAAASGMPAPQEFEASAWQVYKTLRAKAAAWCSRCGGCQGGPAAVERALRELPLPPASAAVGGEEDEYASEAVASRLRAASSDAALRAAVECPICFGTICEPVTTPCGHTFCRRCLARNLDWEGGCPLCRGRLGGHIGAHSVSVQLQGVLAALWPEEHQRHLDEEAAELQEMRDGDWLPILTPVLAIPTQDCNVHVVQPKYRLMVRRIVASGLRRFGACPALGLGDGDGEAGRAAPQDVGTELAVEIVHVFPDGRSLIKAIGRRRFRVLQAEVHDGYPRARVEYLDDVEEAVPRESIQQLVTALRDCAILQGPMPTLPHVLDVALLRGDASAAACAIASMGPAGVSELVWAALQCMAGPLERKVPFLAMSSIAARVAALEALLNPDPQNSAAWHMRSAAEASGTAV